MLSLKMQMRTPFPSDWFCTEGVAQWAITGVPESSHKPFAQVWCLGVYNWFYNNILEHLVFRSHISESHRIVKYGEFSLQMALGTLEYICQHQEHWWSWGGNPGRAATSYHLLHVSSQREQWGPHFWCPSTTLLMLSTWMTELTKSWRLGRTQHCLFN